MAKDILNEKDIVDKGKEKIEAENGKLLGKNQNLHSENIALKDSKQDLEKTLLYERDISKNREEAYKLVYTSKSPGVISAPIPDASFMSQILNIGSALPELKFEACKFDIGEDP